MKIAIVVKGGMVQDVFATSYDADVEVIDLDAPEFATENELAEFNAKERQVEDIRKSVDWLPVW